jgi:hypothetical protein
MGGGGTLDAEVLVHYTCMFMLRVGGMAGCMR